MLSPICLLDLKSMPVITLALLHVHFGHLRDKGSMIIYDRKYIVDERHNIFGLLYL